jgi:DNA-binding NtrC family response regulator
MKTVIIVDPDFAISDIGNIISRHGFMAIVMPEAQTALNSVRNGLPVDLVITELLLPDMEGMEFLYAVKKSAPEIPVLVVSSEHSIESYLRAMSGGAFDYLHKPARDADLCRCARHAVNLPVSGPLSSRAA